MMEMGATAGQAGEIIRARTDGRRYLVTETGAWVRLADGPAPRPGEAPPLPEPAVMPRSLDDAARTMRTARGLDALEQRMAEVKASARTRRRWAATITVRRRELGA